MLDWSFNGTDISSYKSKMEVLCKYFYWKLQIPRYSTMQFPFTHLAWLLWLCLLQCSGCQWMDLMRRSCERLEDNYSDLPVQRLNDLVSPVLGWAGLVYTDQSTSWPGAAHLLWPVMSTPAVISSQQQQPPHYSCQPHFAEHNVPRYLHTSTFYLLKVDLLKLLLLDLCGQASPSRYV